MSGTAIASRIRGINVSLGSDRLGGIIGSHRTIFREKLNEVDGKTLVETRTLKEMLCLLQLFHLIYKGPLQCLLFNVCAHNVT